MGCLCGEGEGETGTVSVRVELSGNGKWPMGDERRSVTGFAGTVAAEVDARQRLGLA